VADRHRTVLLSAAALLVMGGFGFALSMVGDTASSNPVPGGADGTAQVSAPQAPTPSRPSDATASAPPPAGGGAGVSAAPTSTSAPPGDNGRRDDERGEQGHEDGDGADDG